MVQWFLGYVGCTLLIVLTKGAFEWFFSTQFMELWAFSDKHWPNLGWTRSDNLLAKNKKLRAFVLLSVFTFLLSVLFFTLFFKLCTRNMKLLDGREGFRSLVRRQYWRPANIVHANIPQGGLGASYEISSV